VRAGRSATDNNNALCSRGRKGNREGSTRTKQELTGGDRRRVSRSTSEDGEKAVEREEIKEGKRAKVAGRKLALSSSSLIFLPPYLPSPPLWTTQQWTVKLRESLSFPPATAPSCPPTRHPSTSSTLPAQQQLTQTSPDAVPAVRNTRTRVSLDRRVSRVSPALLLGAMVARRGRPSS
jgi:hypothetical protein